MMPTSVETMRRDLITLGGHLLLPKGTRVIVLGHVRLHQVYMDAHQVEIILLTPFGIRKVRVAVCDSESPSTFFRAGFLVMGDDTHAR